MLIGLQIGAVEVRLLSDRLGCVIQTKEKLEIVGWLETNIIRCSLYNNGKLKTIEGEQLSDCMVLANLYCVSSRALYV